MNYKRIYKRIRKIEDIVVVPKKERKNTMRKIVLHHTDISQKINPQFQTIRRIHEKERGWDGVGYNFVIEPDGKIIQGRAVGIDTAAQKGGNTKYLSISLAGNFMTEKPTAEQITSLRWLVNALEKKVEKKYKNTIIGHRDVNKTLCPGENIDMEEVKKWLKDEDGISLNTRQTIMDKIYQIIFILSDVIKILLAKK